MRHIFTATGAQIIGPNNGFPEGGCLSNQITDSCVVVEVETDAHSWDLARTRSLRRPCFA